MDETSSDASPAPPPAYSAENIQVLSGLEAIRRRPGMYVGSSDARGLHQMLRWVVDFALEEVLAGAGRAVEVRLHRDGSATVRDDGAGVRAEPGEGEPSLEQRMTLTHLRGCHSGFELPVLCALSASVEVEFRRAGVRWRQSFVQGEATSAPERLGATSESGTTFVARPDPEIFGEATFDAGRIAGHLADLAALNPEVRFEFRDDRSDRSEAWERRAGLVDLVLDRNRGRAALHEPIAIEGRCGGIALGVAFQYHEGPDLDLNIFANQLRIPDRRSTHVVGFLDALREALEPAPRFGDEARRPRSNRSLAHLVGLTAAIAIRMDDPWFAGALRERLANREAGPIAFSIAFLRLFAHFEEHPEIARRIRARIARTASEGGRG